MAWSTALLVAVSFAGVISSHTAAPLPVGAYAFNEGTGTTTADLSGNDNLATLSNSLWTTAGKFGGAVVLNGTSSLVSVPDSSTLDPTTAVTLEAWVRPATSVSGSRTVIAKEKSGGDFPYGIELTNGVARAYVTTASGFAAASGGSALALNTWTFLAASYDGTTLRLYRNNTLVASASANGPLSVSSDPLRMGGDVTYGEHFSGRLDNVRIYSAALSATQISSDRQTGVASSPSPAPSPTATPTASSTATASSSPTASPTPTPVSAGAVGTSGLQPTADSSGQGTVEAFVTPTATAGTISRLNVYLASGTTASNIAVGLYSDNNGQPGTLLTSGIVSAPVLDGWNSVAVPAYSISAGPYWLALLGQDGSVAYRDNCCGGGTAAQTAAGTDTSLPNSWTTGTYISNDGPLSAYADNGGPAPTPTPVPTATAIPTPTAGPNPTPTPAPGGTGTTHVCSGRSFYIDYLNGSDGNSGTSQSSPWKLAPGMRGFSGSYSHQAHDCFYLKGGVTWPASTLPWTISGSGDGSSNDYYGPNYGWYNGASWSQPTLDAGDNNIGSTKNEMIDAGSVDYLTLDNLRLDRFAAHSYLGSYGTCELINALGAQHDVLDHLTGSNEDVDASSDANQPCSSILGATYAPFQGNSVVQNSTFYGKSSSVNSAGGGILCFGNIKNVVMHDLTGMFYPCGHGEISGNLLYDCGFPNWPANSSYVHADAIQTDAADGAFYFHDNVIHDTGVDDTHGNECESMFVGNPSETDYAWDNVFYNLHGNSPALVQDNLPGIAAYFWENTIVGGRDGSQYCLRGGHVTSGMTGVAFRNNHCITDAGQAVDPAIVAGTVTVDHNLTQTTSQASAAGYTAAQVYAYSPPALNSPTVNIGADLSSLCSGILASICRDSNYANTRPTAGRPQSGGWDAGAYER